MPLKFKISPSAWEGLAADVKKEYVKDGDDYRLDVDGYEDPTALKNARDHEKAAAAEAKRQAAAEKARADAAEKKASDLEKAGSSVDDAIKAKDAEWQAKYDKDLGETNKKLTNLTNAVTGERKSSLAMQIATEVSTVPKILARELESRFEVEIDPETYKPKHYIIGSDGKRTTWTVDDLKKDVLKNPEYAPILRATKATGGGGTPPSPGGSGAPRQQTSHRPGTPSDDLTKLSGEEFAARIAESRQARGVPNP